ncbi:glutamine synthetase [Desulfitobacterium dichloroeliminans LMG P-21439]|uniref:Glutamine synthetase n=1 Tax=Desulfitobacterium dichloroeliminans (strain LMG P-21439 / DCA1) TaxID=871963 RepID=L0F6C5_DESDL|nr:glutamine synthetase III [Desulfitobacterium dichloroeliminans]AGA68565.1 glutamine synthetase [Desulfitobacterium dichloroeliminans LMG P-21439]
MDFFGKNVFNDTVMREKLPKNTYKALHKTLDEGLPLQLEVAEVVANAMKDWAIENGATHYTHWFQPMTGYTAEKHDSFISPTADGRVIMEFSGKELIKGEPDASSFPNGGIRSTFEARGYTAWDCTSPAFLREDAGKVILCIPTAFCSYTGEALDKKTPLLRSMETLSKQALRILRLFGNSTAKRVTPTVGAEQEFFLIEKKYHQKRLDLMLTGRTLFGVLPPKGQEMEDHYFGSINERVTAFMQEVNIELWKLGVPAKTQHKEAAPGQYEIAPIFATTNIATDHNQLIMDTLHKVANRHALACLLHEKPFAGVNGSGKHNNWSLSTDEGANLLEPGTTPHENAQFLTFICAVIKAVDDNAELLRASAANPGNDHRLGANEAPPAIISIFLGDELSDIIEQLKIGKPNTSKQGGQMTIGVSTLPSLPKDSTDRNRTSPFAFTGNKFEFRMVPSSLSIAGPNVIINTIVAEVLSQMADRLEQADDFHSELQAILREVAINHSRVIFDGNGYSEEWVKEAERRGLPNLTSTVEAISALISNKTIDLFKKHGVFSHTELHSRYEIYLELYSKTINIEALTMIDVAKRQVLPAVVRYSTELANSINTIRTADPKADVSAQKDLLNEIAPLLKDLGLIIKDLQDATTAAKQLHGDAYRQGILYRDLVFKTMNELRQIVDHLEVLVDYEMWPLPSYTKMLFRL